jgi:hypothetical protein
MKKTISKTSFAFFSKHGLESGKLESLLQILSYNQYFFFVLKASTRANFSSTSFLKSNPGLRKVEFTVVGPLFFMLILRHVHQKMYKKSVIRNLKILSDEKLRTDIGFNLKPPRALYLVLRRSDVDSPEGQK